MRRVLVEEGMQIAREYYLALLVDRAAAGARVHRQRGRRDRDRGGRGGAAGGDPQGRRRSRAPATRPGWGAGWPTGSASRASRRARRPSSCAALYAAFVGHRRLAARDQPADRRPATAASWPSTPRSASTTTRCTAIPSSASCATSSEEDPLEVEASQARPQLHQARRQRRAAWSTARAWRWGRWTSSSTTAGSPANFLDVGGGASAGDGHGRLPDPARPTPTCGPC